MPHHLARWTGLAGSALLAVAAVLGGALPDGDLRPTPVSIWRGPNGPLIIATWLVGTGLMAYAWWTLRDRVPSARWALVTVGLWLLPLLFAPPLGSRDVYAYACQGASYAAGINPYEQGVSALPCPWLDTISYIWRDTPAPYGPLFVMLSGAVVAATGSLTASIVLFRLIAVAGVALTAACLPVLARRCGVPVGRALWLALACPLVAVHLVSGAHNDALMVGLLVAGLAVVVSRPGRPGPLLAGGALLGLAGAVKVTALVVVPFAALAAIVGAYSIRALLRDGGWVVGGAVAAVVGVTLAAGLDFGWIAGLEQGGLVIAWTSPSTAVGQTVAYLAAPFGWHGDPLPVTRGIGMAVLALVLIWLWWRARTRDPLWHAGLALAATVALAPLFHPWYWIWPLTVLAATARHRTGWFTVVALVSAFLVLADGTGLPRYTKTVGAPLMTLLVIVVAVRLVRSARAARRPVAVD
ncbi:polyprenol phosphomannose-dependent alpha 1,6 mannosyltransferase MptB [Micromonospora sp. C28SCA-DRY-2]|uniref:polyprenol phosphomannose-dependent alpha 1,6 mannosyltransferase MptB n=1 Tax=Micromonospora sp. C28SCA-DRY-2 TaxID=3059522 RepID=UPI002674B975|nr:polyprenol phosphomannose-dependent alpha 1,6 mannosyltransferase MptB [Micromonospora sp. C28SCA-DRY-2]MDO3701707.1 polyprenol phosphomannose-dependent alpha 1,6 mannosyltransferase MptB [Micromonospora sp. C28SCA-DRY-2]